MNILGLSASSQDGAACLIQDGEVVAVAQEEEFAQKKHDVSIPANAIASCLQLGKINGEDLDYIAFSGKPFLQFERMLESYLAFAPQGFRSFLKEIPLWVKQKLWIKEHLKRETGFQGKIIFPEHHESLAVSAFFPSPFGDAAFLTIDSVGEWATASYGVGNENGVTILAEMLFPHSLGLLYSAFTSYSGFTVKSGENKLMELAAYGEPKYRKLILSELMDFKEDGSFKLNMAYFDCCAGLVTTNAKFDELFGRPPRAPETEPNAMDMDIACSIQAVTETVLLNMVEHVYKQTGRKNLCLTGEVALNTAANESVWRESSFDDVWIRPAGRDTDAAIGAALFTWHQYLGNKKSVGANDDLQKKPSLGPERFCQHIPKKLDRKHVNNMEFTEAERSCKKTNRMHKQQEQIKTMCMTGQEDRISIDRLHRFGIFFSVIMALVAWNFLWQERVGGFIFSFTAFFLLMLTLFKPLVLKGPYRLWKRIADVPARVLTKVLFTFLFFCVFTPVGMVARLLKIDFLDIKLPRNGSSYWEKSPDSYWAPRKKRRSGGERFEKQY